MTKNILYFSNRPIIKENIEIKKPEFSMTIERIIYPRPNLKEDEKKYMLQNYRRSSNNTIKEIEETLKENPITRERIVKNLAEDGILRETIKGDFCYFHGRDLFLACDASLENLQRTFIKKENLEGFVKILNNNEGLLNLSFDYSQLAQKRMRSEEWEYANRCLGFTALKMLGDISFQKEWINNNLSEEGNKRYEKAVEYWNKNLSKVKSAFFEDILEGLYQLASLNVTWTQTRIKNIPYSLNEKQMTAHIRDSKTVEKDLGIATRGIFATRQIIEIYNQLIQNKPQDYIMNFYLNEKLKNLGEKVKDTKEKLSKIIEEIDEVKRIV